MFPPGRYVFIGFLYFWIPFDFSVREAFGNMLRLEEESHHD
jgi:hypothetical protein